MHDLLLGTGFGLVTASILALSAVGVSLQYSVTNVPNFAWGELMTVGAYGAYVAQQTTQNIAVEVLSAIICGGLLAFAMNALILQPFLRKGTKPLILFALTIAIGIVVQNSLEFIFTGNPVSIAVPDQRASEVGPFLFTSQSLVIMVSAVLVMLALHLLLRYTRFGKAQRAVGDSIELARNTGINTARVVNVTWLIAGMIAGLAGYFLATSQGTFDAFLGFDILLPTFAAAVLGGIGKVYGAMLGALVVGVAMEVSALYIPANYKQSLAFGLLIIVLLIRPTGILGIVRQQVGSSA